MHCTRPRSSISRCLPLVELLLCITRLPVERSSSSCFCSSRDLGMLSSLYRPVPFTAAGQPMLAGERLMLPMQKKRTATLCLLLGPKT